MSIHTESVFMLITLNGNHSLPFGLFFMIIGVSLFMFSASHIHHEIPQGISFSLKNFRPDLGRKKKKSMKLISLRKKKSTLSGFSSFLRKKKPECFWKLGNAWKNTTAGCLLHCSPMALIMNNSPSGWVLGELVDSQDIAFYWVWVRMAQTDTRSVTEVFHCHLNLPASGYQQWHLWGCYGIQRNLPEVIQNRASSQCSLEAVLNFICYVRN